MHRREKAFIKDDDEEMPEIKQRKMEVLPSEKERIKRKRKEEHKKRRMKKEEEKLLAKLKKKEKQEKEVAEKPKVQKNQIIHLHPTRKVLLHHVTSGDAGVRKNGTNGMLRRKVSIGSRRAGATGLATFGQKS